MKQRQALEAEFEDAIVMVLQQDYDLAVRHGREKLDRRSSDTAVLEFRYQHDEGDGVSKVVIGVKGVREFSTVLSVDFSSEDTISQGAEECEALALYLMEHLSDRREALLAELDGADLDGNDGTYGRREDDLA